MEEHAADQVHFTLPPFDAHSPYLDEAVRIYTAIWPADHADIRAFIARYATYPGFHGLVALVKNRVVGMGFGTRSLPGNWWHDRIATQIGAGHPALQDAWVLVELAVLEVYRNEGIQEGAARCPAPESALPARAALYGGQQ